MRILFLVSSRSTAGSRIRYGRLKAASRHFAIEIRTIDEISRADLDHCDICIFSKTFSSSAIALAKTLRERGVLVGIDLFDDYFSQAADPRLTIFRSWLSSFGSVVQFATCSTPTMRQVITHLVPQLPVHLVPDPCAEIDAETIAASVPRALERCRATGVIDVLWFGNGSNPFFSVGLQDLSAYSWSLAELAAGRYEVALKVLCDDASMTPGNLMRLKNLPVPYTTQTWSVALEREALEQALVAFIPVNGQPFSRAKSPNRAITAISAGAQVLSPGFPLYRDIDDLIYGKAADLLTDIERGDCRIGPGRIEDIQRAVASDADFDATMMELCRSPTGRSRASEHFHRVETTGGASATDALLFGIDQEQSMKHATATANILSIKSPYARFEGDYDVRLDLGDDQRLEVWIRPEVSPYLAAPFTSNLSAPRQVGRALMVRLADSPELRLDRPLAVSPMESHGIVFETAAYRRSIASLARVCRRVFPSLGLRVAGLSASQGSELAHEGASQP